MKRSLAITLRVLPVMLVAGIVGVVGVAGAAEDAAPDLRAALRPSATAAERVAALERGAKAERIGDPDAALRAAATLIGEAPDAALTLLRRALEEAHPSEDLVRGARTELAATTASHAALGVLLGVRGDATLLDGPLSEAAAAVLRADAPEIRELQGPPSGWDRAKAKAAWERHVRAANLLDRALEDGAGVGDALPTPMQELVAAKDDVRSYLLAVAAPRDGGTPPGWIPRRVRAIVALGMMRERAATPLLVQGLEDRNGWVRVASANALGDVGDPSAIGALARVLFYLGDLDRPRDSWDYPGPENVNVSLQDWQSVEYYAVDEAAADALLRLGVRNAAGWLISERLDPRRGNWRVRVLQDALDALRRSFPDLRTDFQPDGGVPTRLAAWRALRAWWKTDPALARPVDENDPGFRRGIAPLVEAVTGRSVMHQQIAGNVIELLGAPATPSILAALGAATRPLHRSELAVALGRTRDPRAVPALVALSGEPAPNVRAAATVALGAFLRGPPGRPGGRDALDAVLARVGDPVPGPRAAAFEALASAPDDPRVVAAARAATAGGSAPDDGAPQRVALLVQTGEGLDGLLDLLRHAELWRRRQVWELLRRGLDLEPDLFDPGPDPGTPGARPIDAEAVREALRRRRGR